MASEKISLANNTILHNLNRTETQLAKSVERLSSGTRLALGSASAGDQVMIAHHQKEISALKTIAVATQQSSDILRTAENTAAVIQDMMTRMRVLAVNATQADLSVADRALLDVEFQKLKGEIDRIAKDATYGGFKVGETGFTPIYFTDSFDGNVANPDLVLRGDAAIVNEELRLTEALGFENGAAISDFAIDTQGGLIANFRYYAGGFTGTRGADGFTFFFADASSQTAASLTLGAPGGSLGYINMSDAVMGIGFDEWGNFSVGRGGPGFRDQNIVLRGDSASNYTYVAGEDLTALGGVDGGYRDVRITVSSDLIVNVDMSFDGGSTFTTVLNNVDFQASTGLTALPEEVLFGFTGSTGGSNNIHSIDNIDVVGSLDVERRMLRGGHETSVGTGIFAQDRLNLPIMDMTLRGLTLQQTNLQNQSASVKAIERLDFAEEQLMMGRAITNAHAAVLDQAYRLNIRLDENLQQAYGQIAYTDIPSEITKLNQQTLNLQSGLSVLYQNNSILQFLGGIESQMLMDMNSFPLLSNNNNDDNPFTQN